MTGPDEPWDFPELSPPPTDPTSFELPDPGPEPIYDTGSDGWWRAQARAQREAAGDEPPPLLRPLPAAPTAPLDPADLIEATVLNDPAYLPSGPSPLEAAYLEPEEVFAPAAFEQPVADELPADLPPYEPADLPADPPPYDEPALAETSYEEAAYREPAFEEPPAPLPPARLVTPPIAEGWYDAPPRVVAEERVGLGRALAWAALAVAGVGLLVVAFLLLSKDEPQGTPTVAAPSAVVSTAPTTEPTPSPTPTPTPTPVATKVAVAPLAPVVPLTVLNNSRISHLAERAAAKFRDGGWPIAGTGNYRGKLTTTTIFYPDGQRESALRFAKQFGVRVLPRPAGLPGSGMTVVVTRDFA